MAYTFEQIFAADPSTPENVATNGLVTIFAPGDAAQTPLTITTVDGLPLANPIKVNDAGYGPAFMHATLDRVAWAGGGFTGFFTSYDGMKEEAVAARRAAGVAASAARDAAALANAATFAKSQIIAYNEDGAVAAISENGIVTSYTYNNDGTVATDSRQGITRQYSYTNGNLTGIEAV